MNHHIQIPARVQREAIQTTTMPPKARQTSRNLVEQEGRIQLAIQSLKNNEIQSIRRAAEAFRVPYLTLFRRLNGN